MTFIKNNWLSLIVLAACLTVILIFLYQKKSDSGDLNAYKLQELSDQLKTITHERDSLQKSLDASQDSIVNHLDSLLHVQVDNQDKILYALQHQRDNIPVPNYGTDTLRSYFSKLRPIYHDLHTE